MEGAFSLPEHSVELLFRDSLNLDPANRRIAVNNMAQATRSRKELGRVGNTAVFTAGFIGELNRGPGRETDQGWLDALFVEGVNLTFDFSLNG